VHFHELKPFRVEDLGHNEGRKCVAQVIDDMHGFIICTDTKEEESILKQFTVLLAVRSDRRELLFSGLLIR
jgi:hypothetical protein